MSDAVLSCSVTFGASKFLEDRSIGFSFSFFFNAPFASFRSLSSFCSLFFSTVIVASIFFKFNNFPFESL